MPVWVTRSVVGLRAKDRFGNFSQIAVDLQLGLLVSLSRWCLARSFIGGGSLLRFAHGFPPHQLFVKSRSQ